MHLPPRTSWDEDFVKSFPDFFAFAEWDNKRHTEAELKEVYKSITGIDPDAPKKEVKPEAPAENQE